MKRFLIKTLIIGLPFLIFLIGLEWRARMNDDSSLQLRKTYLAEHKNEINTLILGPSHIMRAIDLNIFEKNALSLAISGSGMNADYRLFEAVKNSIQPKLIIIDLSKGYLEKTQTEEWMRFHKLKYYFGVKFDKFKLKDCFLVNYPLYRYFNPKKSKLNPWGANKIRKRKKVFTKHNYNKAIIDTLKQINELIEAHSYFSDKDFNANQARLRKVINYCKEKGIKVLFVSPPKYYLYNQLLSEKHQRRRVEFLDSVIDNKNVFFEDYESLYEQEPKYFYNYNHVNLEGAQFFTETLNKRLKALGL